MKRNSALHLHPNGSSIRLRVAARLHGGLIFHNGDSGPLQVWLGQPTGEGCHLMAGLLAQRCQGRQSSGETGATEFGCRRI